MSDTNRGSGGKYTPAVSDEDILEAIDRIPGPVTTAAELADALPIGRRAIRERLKDFEERGLVARKKVGGRAVVWWISSDEKEDNAPDFRAGYGAFAGTDFADTVDEVSDELDRDFRESEDELFEDEADA